LTVIQFDLGAVLASCYTWITECHWFTKNRKRQKSSYFSPTLGYI